MKAATTRQITQAIRSAVPRLYGKGRLLAAIPRGRILRGIYIENSSNPERVYAWAFVQPLYAPASTVVFDFGMRLGGPSRTWSAGDADALAKVVRDEGVPFFSPVSSPEALTVWSYLDCRGDPYAREAKAYSLIASGKFSDGVQALRELAGSLSREIEWMNRMKKRAERLASLAETNPTAAHELLAMWESETVSALRVQDLP
jgi:hypothetical protein